MYRQGVLLPAEEDGEDGSWDTHFRHAGVDGAGRGGRRAAEGHAGPGCHYGLVLVSLVTASTFAAYAITSARLPADRQPSEPAASVVLEQPEFTSVVQGCLNWDSILQSKGVKSSAQECWSSCASTPGCRHAGYQFNDCPGLGPEVGSCYLYNDECTHMDNSCWQLLSQSPVPSPAAAPAISSPDSSLTDVTLHPGTGCSNWQTIQLGSTQTGLTVEQCQQQCQTTARCQAFGFQPTATCGGQGVAAGACMLFSDDGCGSEDNSCWNLYVMQPGKSYCDKGEGAPVIPGTRAEVITWAAGMVSKMTTEEKRSLARGTLDKGSWVGLVPAVSRLGIPTLTMQDGPQGFRTTEPELVGQVTSWPCALAAAATWDVDSVKAWAEAMGSEFKAKGGSVALGPGVNVARVPLNGRNAEYLSGEDPYLGAKLAAAYVTGMQSQGVAAVVKHFVNNEQETHREDVDVVIDERTRWEVYYPPFQAAVDAGVASVMCAYNAVNGEHACENSQILQEDLKGTMGFDGWVMTDWDALKTGGGAAAGADQDLPAGNFFTDEVLAALPVGRLDDMAQRVLQGMARVWSASSNGPCAPGCRCDGGGDIRMGAESTASLLQGHADLAREVATKGAVLLKNDASVLPLKAGQKVAVIGSVCNAPSMSLSDTHTNWLTNDYYIVGGSGRVASRQATSVLHGLRDAGVDLTESATDNLVSATAALAGAQVAVVCAGAKSSEAHDRKSLKLDQDAFVTEVLAVAQANSVPVVVVALAPGPIVMSWRSSAAAVLLMFLSGEQTGGAAANVLTGAASPSGKLPVVMPETELEPVPPCAGTTCEYSEKLYSGWHWYDGGKPKAYPFGHGLSYTTFEYSLAQELSQPGEGGKRSMTVRVNNTGAVAGSEVVQLYLDFPETAGEPKRLLRGFARTPVLQPHESHDVVLELTERDLSIWDVGTHGWKPPSPADKFQVMVGASSQDLRLCGSFTAEVVTNCHSESCGAC